jgi:CBS domain-containing protein
LSADEEIGEAIATLRARGVRRAPVVDAHGELVGLVSTDDLVGEVARQVGALAGLLQRQPAWEGHQYAEL